jgi:hypothetical protein
MYRVSASIQKEAARPVFWKSVFLLVCVIVASIIVAEYFYDVSFDGQSYHMESVYQLGTTWNPTQRELPDSVNLTEAIYVNHYPKGSEIPQAAIYQVTHRLESGKATNLMLLAAAFFLCLAYLYRLNRHSFRQIVFISALFVLSPVTIGELISFYVDGEMSLLILAFLVLSCMVVYEEKWYNVMTLGSVVVLMINLKFTGVLFAAIFSSGLLVYLLVKGKKPVFRRILLNAAAAGLIGILIAGYYPYVTNFRNYGTPFYPVMGPGQKDIISNVYPTRFSNMNRFQKLYISFFSHTDELKIYEDKNPRIPLKLPFTVNKTDLINAPKLGIKMAGFGPFFSGAVFLSLVLYLMLWLDENERKKIFDLTLVLVVLLISVFLVPEAWWARLVPQLWFFPLLVAFGSGGLQTRTARWLRGIIYASLVVNIMLSSLIIPWNLLKTEEVKYQLDQLKSSRDTLQVEFSYFKSNRFRLRENGIPYVEHKLPDSNISYLVHSSTKFLPPSSPTSLPPPLLVEWSEKLKNRLKH